MLERPRRPRVTCWATLCIRSLGPLLIVGCPGSPPTPGGETDAAASSESTRGTETSVGPSTSVGPGSTMTNTSAPPPTSGLETGSSSSVGSGGSTTEAGACPDDPAATMTCEQVSETHRLCETWASCACDDCACLATECALESGCFEVLACAAARGCPVEDCLSDEYCGPRIEPLGGAAINAAIAFVECAVDECFGVDACDTSPDCPNGKIDTGEQCDGDDLNGFTCASLGLPAGQLVCDPFTCTFDSTGCTG